MTVFLMLQFGTERVSHLHVERAEGRLTPLVVADYNSFHP